MVMADTHSGGKSRGEVSVSMVGGREGRCRYHDYVENLWSSFDVVTGVGDCVNVEKC